MKISTHVLDLGRGKPASEITVHLERREAAGHWRLLATGQTDEDGRCSQLLPEDEALTPGVYRLAFNTGSYYALQKMDSLFPLVEVVFQVRQGEDRFHIPLLLSRNGYTTYRGT